MFCSHCGNEVLDEAVVCPKCGCLISKKEEIKNVKNNNENNDGKKNISYYFDLSFVALILLVPTILFIILGYDLFGFRVNYLEISREIVRLYHLWYSLALVCSLVSLIISLFTVRHNKCWSKITLVTSSLLIIIIVLLWISTSRIPL